VHEWCLRHLFLELQHYGGVSRGAGAGLTFLASGVLHELVFGLAFGCARPWFLMGMLAQLPLAALAARGGEAERGGGEAERGGGEAGRGAPMALRGRRRGNLIVWASLMIGQPLLLLLYHREWAARAGQGDIFCLEPPPGPPGPLAGPAVPGPAAAGTHTA